MTQEMERTGFGWGSLAEGGVFTLVVAGVATMVFVIRGLDLALAIDLVAMLVGVALINRDRRGGAIVLLIATIVFLAFGGFFAVQVLSVPRSTIYFILSAVYLVAGVATLVASLAILRRGRSPSRVARKVALIATLLFVLTAALAVVVRLSYDEPAPASGDVNLLARNNEFKPRTVVANGPEVSVVIANEDLSLHTFSIEELDVSHDLPGGVRSRVIFEAEPATYVFYCEIFGHDDMKGTLTVR